MDLDVSEKHLNNIFEEKKVVPELDKKESSELSFQKGDLKIKLGGSYRPEVAFGSNLRTFNGTSDYGKMFFVRHTFDLNVESFFGKKEYGHDIIQSKASLRTRAKWGNPESVSKTSSTPSTIAGVTSVGSHNHYIPRNILWVRELWAELDVAECFRIKTDKSISLKLGAFPFQLGSGMSFGPAFALAPGVLGSYSEASIDQYAYGVLLSLSPDREEKAVELDIYFALLENKSDSLSSVSEKIYSSAYTGSDNPYRGFGLTDYVIATRAKWEIFKKDEKSINVEPYFFFNREKEQKVEFTADAESMLSTIGLSADFQYNRLSFGVECAANLGRQNVRGWDRNVAEIINRDGSMIVVNSHVFSVVDAASQDSTTKIKYNDAAVTQGDIDGVTRTSDQNLERVGSHAAYNGQYRFRDAYKNTYGGWAFVTNASYWAIEKELCLSAEFGLASGDKNPNQDIDSPNDSDVDGNYKGFIGLQNLFFSGKKISSMFVLGGAGQHSRPLTIPNNNATRDKHATFITGFTDIRYLGLGAEWTPADSKRNLSVKPNLVAYWDDFDTNKYDASAGQSTDELASKFMGVEANTTVSFELLKNIKASGSTSVFFPGTYYKDIKGLPLPGADSSITMGDAIAFTFGFSVEYTF
jgi:hypothetical protein